MTHSLTLGSLLLTDDMPEANHGYVFSVLAEGASFGVAQGVQEVVRSLLADGDLVRTTRHGNREVTFRIQITGPSLGALAEGEAALRRETGRPNLLTWQAPDILSVSTVFEVIDSDMAQSFNDLDELRTRRTFEITLTCAPRARSLDPVMVDALEVTGTAEVIIDNCNSATGWSATWNGVTLVNQPDPNWLGQAGSLFVYDLFTPGPQTMTLTRAGSFNAAFTPYIRVNVHATEPEDTSMGAVVDGVPLPNRLELVSKRKSPADADLYEFVWKLPAGSDTVNSLTLVNYSKSDTAAFGVTEVARSGNPPATSPRQVTRVLEVGGTERTTGSVRIASRDVNDLGMTMVHTTPASDFRGATGYSPSLRQWRTFGNTIITDAARLSGFSETLSPNPFVAQVPNVAIPDGPYFVAAMLRSSASLASRIHWTVRTVSDAGAGINIVGEEERVSSFNFAAGVWSLVPLGVISLPVAQAMDAVTRLDIESEAGDPATIHIDDAYLFWAAEGCGLTIVNNAKKHLWLDTPDLSSRVPTYWTGTDPSRVDAYHPGDGLVTPGEHSLLPGEMRVWVATSGTTYPGVSGSYYERWHSNAAR